MKNLSGISRGRIVLLFVTFLAIPLFRWTALSKSVPGSALGNSQASETIVLPSISTEAFPAGDVERGQKLFMGNLHFQNDGPPCMGCHNIGSNGILGGGALGPDLTNVATRRSQSELATTLANPGPVMQPIYAEYPLTTEEQADLLAFMDASVGQPETNREGLVIGISVVGFFAAAGLLELVYHRRLHGVRKPMLRKAYSRKL